MKKIFLWTFVLAFLTSAWAGNRFPVAQVSFSSNSEQVLAITAGIADGNGFPHARLVLLSTKTGKKLRDITFEPHDSSRSSALVLNELLEKEKALLIQYGLWPGLNSVAKWQDKIPHHIPQWNEGIGAGSTKVWPVSFWGTPIPIELKVHKAKQNKCEYQGMIPKGDVPAYFTLKVGKQMIPTSFKPLSPCTSRYSIERVDLQSNRVLITLRAYSVGYEGPNATAVFVAAELK